MYRKNYFRKPGLLLAFMAIGAGGLLWSGSVAATPSFARQMNMQCSGCHFQSFPALNEYGRHFRATGYTEAKEGNGDMVEGTGLSIPAGLNTSIVTKLRYTSTDGGTAKIDFPDELALFVAGRASKKIGYLFELAMVTEPTIAVGSNKLSALASGKIHFNLGEAGGTHFSLIPFTTDGAGAGYGFELLNTGAQKSQRIIENGDSYSASMRLQLGHAAATGVTLAGMSDHFFVNATMWTPGHNDSGMDPSTFANYFRFGYMPKVGDWDAAVGVQLASGTAVTGSGATSSKTDAWVIDGQMQGKVGQMPLGVYASYGAAAAGHYKLSNTSERTAYGLLGKLGVTDKTSVFAAYAASSGDVSQTSSTLGLQYMMAQNAKLELYGSEDAGVRTTRLMLFAGF